MDFLPQYEHFIRARDELCARIVAARTERFNRTIKGTHFEDDPGMINADLIGEETAPLVFHLIYEDAKGDLTGRGFKMNKLAIAANTDLYVGGVCYLRHRYRSFKASRIVELTDLATGEVFEDGVKFFRMHPLLERKTSDLMSSEEKAIRAVRDEVIALTLIAAVDGDVHDAEMDKIVKFVAFSWDEPLDEDKLRRRLMAFVPDENAFHRAMNRIYNRPQPAHRFVRAMRAVIDADRVLHAGEIAFVDYIVRELKKAGRLPNA